jgi:hypothetical protein
VMMSCRARLEYTFENGSKRIIRNQIDRKSIAWTSRITPLSIKDQKAEPNTSHLYSKEDIFLACGEPSCGVWGNCGVECGVQIALILHKTIETVQRMHFIATLAFVFAFSVSLVSAVPTPGDSVDSSGSSESSSSPVLERRGLQENILTHAETIALKACWGRPKKNQKGFQVAFDACKAAKWGGS